MIYRKRLPKHRLILDDPRFQSPYKNTKSKNKNRLMAKWLFALIFLTVISMAISELARASGVSSDEQYQHTTHIESLSEAESGQLVFPSGNGTFQQAVHLKTTADIQVSGMVARVSYKQIFKNDSNDWREAVYVFPLSENAAVNEMEMRIGNRLIRAEIKEKSEAKKIYEKAKSEGKKTALTEQQRPNLFTQKVANIAPGEEIEITLGYLQEVKYGQDSHGKGTFSFYLPTTLTPRFMPGVPMTHGQTPLEIKKELTSSAFGWATATDQVPDAHKISPLMLSVPINSLRNPIEINISLEAGLHLDKITSRNHSIYQKKNKSGNYQINLSKGHVSMDRDFWLEWTPVASDQPEAAVFKEQINGEDYSLIMLLPPQIAASSQNGTDDLHSHKLPREVIFIIDTSGSMGGASIQQAKASLQMALKRLSNKDRFNIIAFNSSYSNLFYTPMYATKSNRQIASTFVHRLGAGGGTNMAPALEEALSTKSEEGFLKQVLFITDGAVGNEDALFKLIQEKLDNARLFTVAIGSAPNSHFMSRAAQFGRGTFEYIANQSEIAERMSNLFRKLESPVLSNLKISFPKELHGLIEQFPERTPDLYAGEPLVLSIKALDKAAIKGKIEISGRVSGTGSVTSSDTNESTQWTRSLNLNDNTQHQGISTIWARKKIAALMNEKILGRDEADVKEEVLSVAIPHKLISAYTSLVAVEERISREPLAHKKHGVPLKSGVVPNAVAKDQLPQTQSYPKTATWQPFNLLLGSLSLLMLMALYRNQLFQRK